MTSTSRKDGWCTAAECDHMQRDYEVGRLENEVRRAKNSAPAYDEPTSSVSDDLEDQILDAARRTYEIDEELGELNDDILAFSKKVVGRIEHAVLVEKAVMAINRSQREMADVLKQLADVLQTQSRSVRNLEK